MNARNPVRLFAALTIAGLGWAPDARADVTRYMTENPEFTVLPPAYFDPAIAAGSEVDVHIDASAYLHTGTPWRAEIEVGRTIPFPAKGYTKQRVWGAMFPLGAAAVPHARVRLFALERGVEREVVTVGLGAVRPQRFLGEYARGPFSRQASRDWGENGMWLVLIQRRFAAQFPRRQTPAVYVGGDYGMGRVDRLIRYMRLHGYNAFGYVPNYAKRAESLAEIGQHDLGKMRSFLAVAAPGQRADMMGICVGGIVARSMAATDATTPGKRVIASISGVGTPNGGVELADVYASMPLLAKIQSWATFQPEREPFKDTASSTFRFRLQVREPADVPRRWVVLDAGDLQPDDTYAIIGPLLHLVVGYQRGQAPWTIRTDGLVTIESQGLDGRCDTWRCDHMGAINRGRTTESFDAYAAHRGLLDTLAPEVTTP